ncbi:MAG: hypothetical protein CMJ67_06360 [Planctomycetaceae bacterium]|nr:hypothetical protein [Planctomycetaceae bacterium]
MELRSVLLLALGLLAMSTIGCTIRTEGSGPTVATSKPAPSPGLPEWSDPPPATIADLEGRGHPIGFAVMDQDGTAMTMTRLTDSMRVELWRPDSILTEDLPLNLDVLAVESLEARIAIVQLAETDIRSELPIPSRRAVDGLLFAPKVVTDDRLVVILGSLARFNPGERWLVEAFLREGWNVLLSSPPITSPDPEHGSMTVLQPGVDPEAAGRTLAGEIEVAIGAWAVGLTAITTELQQSGRLTDGPTVIVGMSSGGLATPVMAALLNPMRRVDAVVLMATGANPPTILAGTSLKDGDLRIQRRGPRCSTVELEIFKTSYSNASTLESESLWTWFADRPVLLVEAGFDAAIPASARNELRSRIPEADYWWLPTGHFGLFASMINEAEPIVRWVERKCSGRPGTDPQGSADGSGKGASPENPR